MLLDFTVGTSAGEAAISIDADSAGAEARVQRTLVDVLTVFAVKLGLAGRAFLAVDGPIALLARAAPRYADGAATLGLEHHPAEVVFTLKLFLSIEQCWAGALVWWLWEETRSPKAVSSNPGTLYTRWTFFHIYLL